MADQRNIKEKENNCYAKKRWCIKVELKRINRREAECGFVLYRNVRKDVWNINWYVKEKERNEKSTVNKEEKSRGRKIKNIPRTKIGRKKEKIMLSYIIFSKKKKRKKARKKKERKQERKKKEKERKKERKKRVQK